MPEEIDDFTAVLPELIDMASCELKVYDGLDRLWRMVERYKMTTPIAIRVVDNKARCVRAIRTLAIKQAVGNWRTKQLRWHHLSVKSSFR
jgi:hypothetical protein